MLIRLRLPLVRLLAATAALCAAGLLAKLFMPDRVGMFRDGDGGLSFGILASPSGGEELLRWWVIPVALGLAAMLYLLLTKGLRRLLRRR